MTWDYSAINHWWVAFGGDDRVWKITVDSDGWFELNEGQQHHGNWDSLADAKTVAEIHEEHLAESIHA